MLLTFKRLNGVWKKLILSVNHEGEHEENKYDQFCVDWWTVEIEVINYKCFGDWRRIMKAIKCNFSNIPSQIYCGVEKKLNISKKA